MLFQINKTKCKCGHEAVEHYDSHVFCTWVMSGECDCEQFEAAEEEHGITFEIPPPVSQEPTPT